MTKPQSLKKGMYLRKKINIKSRSPKSSVSKEKGANQAMIASTKPKAHMP